MARLTQVSIDFETSHLIFPMLIAVILGLLGLTILITRRRQVTQAGAHWAGFWRDMDKPRTLGTLALTVIYFILMVPVGDIWPNRGFGFLFCSIPFVFAIGLLFMHAWPGRAVAIMAAVALIAPALVWWLFAEVFFLTLP
ncbi:tripartite tricarboxylate transporter TctB family protein [Roseovarius sp. CAU 1744]|uniref:tripartite tricarboxylate transporter TctB family protein n=1 Tax=Roseovarius sp. CAU 1744 TaxID=3140368 RepID=UPI00325A5BD2